MTWKDNPTCEDVKTIHCSMNLCCGDQCTAELQAVIQCYSTNVFSCGPGPISCTPVQPPVPAPVPAPTVPVPAPTSSGGGTCFSGESTVQVLGQGAVQMKDLQVGDLVMTGSPGHFKYQPVYAFGHLNKAVLADFYAIKTDSNNVPLEMTGEHLVYLAKKHNPVRADSLQVGDVLLSINGHTTITSIEMVTKCGLYNPLVADGRLVVNDIAASTYIALQGTNQEHYHVIVGGEYKVNLMSHQSFVHLYLAPFRMFCMGVSSQVCQALDREGIPYYISAGMNLVHWIGTQNVVVQLFFLLVTLPLLVVLLMVEKLVGSSSAPLAILVTISLASKMLMPKQKAV